MNNSTNNITVSFTCSGSEEVKPYTSLLLVKQKLPDQGDVVVNAFRGPEAYELWTKLITRNTNAVELIDTDAPGHKLTATDVRAIRSSYRFGDSQFGAGGLGRKYGVDKKTIYDIVKRKTWRDVE